MPPGGAPARGRQTATLSRLAHERFTDTEVGHLIERAEKEVALLPYDNDDSALVRVTRRGYEQAIRVPSALVSEFNEHFARCYQAWTEARPANDFASVRPGLEKMLDLSRQLANYFPGYEHIADPLIDYADYGMKAATVRKVFSELREQLVPIVKTITAQPVVRRRFRTEKFAIGQIAFNEDVTTPVFSPAPPASSSTPSPTALISHRFMP